MKISIIIPAHNEEKSIRRCLNSCLNQSEKADEIILVNDGSTDKTADIASSLKGVKVINFDKGHSAAFARNRGAEKAKGDILFFLDADQVIEDRKAITKIKQAFRKDSGVVGASLGGCGEFETHMQKIQRIREILTCWYLKSAREQPTYANVASRDAFMKAGMFPEGIFYYEDRVFAKNLKKLGKIINLDIPVRHEEPKDMDEFIRQAKYVGKGMSTINIWDDWKKLLIPLYPPFWVILLLAVLVDLFYFTIPVSFIILCGLLYLFYESYIAHDLSEDWKSSIYFVFFYQPIRAFIIIWSYTKNKVKLWMKL
jgi:glycosyltransferase involved in cell wall biosynthesis